jgi:hypothetical protein
MPNRTTHARSVLGSFGDFAIDLPQLSRFWSAYHFHLHAGLGMAVPQELSPVCAKKLSSEEGACKVLDV